MKLPAPLEASLAQVERQFEEVSAALVSGEPNALLAASTALRQAAIDFSNLMQRLTPLDLRDKELNLRIKRIAQGMAVRRESLIRRTALVERALHAVVPAAGQSTTYANANSPYGSPGKQAGTFKYLSA